MYDLLSMNIIKFQKMKQEINKINAENNKIVLFKISQEMKPE